MISMVVLDQTFENPEANLALDEYLLECAQHFPERNIMRFWESPTYFVVLGLGNKRHTEVNIDQCHAENIPILRRCSGGGTVLQGPGCLNYALILNIDHYPEIHSIPSTNAHVMSRMKDALLPLDDRLEVNGHSDLCIGNKKISGNAQRRIKSHILFHGTILYRFDIEKISRYLRYPDSEPTYRKKRSHQEFVCNLSSSAQDIYHALSLHWDAQMTIPPIQEERLRELITNKYKNSQWINKR